ncbi:hypothetical protein [Bradyrhizobium sp. 192]|nr:hypothetical protein [Bradyrhizobium sp. 192]UPJ60678.1 hypothetical protein IVB24_14175 [Bradyrhizobium sp. 192]
MLGRDQLVGAEHGEVVLYRLDASFGQPVLGHAPAILGSDDRGDALGV